jgi:hypothetical protein
MVIHEVIKRRNLVGGLVERERNFLLSTCPL